MYEAVILACFGQKAASNYRLGKKGRSRPNPCVVTLNRASLPTRSCSGANKPSQLLCKTCLHANFVLRGTRARTRRACGRTKGPDEERSSIELDCFPDFDRSNITKKTCIRGEERRETSQLGEYLCVFEEHANLGKEGKREAEA